MKPKQILSLFKRLAIVIVCSVALITIVAFLPGKIEGQYRNAGIRCMCDCVNFLQFRDDKIVYYSSGHSPAKLIGHYTRNSHGTVDIYSNFCGQGTADELLGHAYPHVLLTRFSWTNDDNMEWAFKYPKIFTVEKTIADQEIASSYINADRSVTNTYYDSSLRPVRTEIELPKKQKNTAVQPADAARQ